MCFFQPNFGRDQEKKIRKAVNWLKLELSDNQRETEINIWEYIDVRYRFIDVIDYAPA